MRTSLFIFTLVVLDLVSKTWAWQFYGQPVEVIGSILSIAPVHNPGTAFGLAATMTEQLVIARIFAVMLFSVLLIRHRDYDLRVRGVYSLGLAGGIGNLYDNLTRYLPVEGNGQVRDFISVDFGIMGLNPYPTFNVADVYLVLAILGLAFVKNQFQNGPLPSHADNAR